jgi:sugar O-acyltransferase (sialic acid O-acetyltransferase NeuD family)
MTSRWMDSAPLSAGRALAWLNRRHEVGNQEAHPSPGLAKLVVYGGGGHGKCLIDLVRALGTYELVGVVDDGLQPGALVMGLTVLGDRGRLSELLEDGVRLAVNGVGGVGDIESRIRVFERLRKAGFRCPTIVHPAATIEPSAQLDEGVQVLPHAYVGSQAEIGFGVILNAGAIVSHDCKLDAYASLAPGALLAGGVALGEAAAIGMGVTVNIDVSVGSRARVGNGAVVKGDVPAGVVVRAGQVWPTGEAG